MKIRFFLLCLLFFTIGKLYGQVSDSLSTWRLEGIRHMQEKLFPEAYQKLHKYVTGASEEEKANSTYSDTYKLYSKSKGEIGLILEELYKAATKAQKKGQMEEAEKLFHEYITCSVTPESKTTFEYTVALTQEALSLSKAGQIDRAMKLLEEVQQTRMRLPNASKYHAAETLNLKASFLSQQGHDDEALEACTQALTLYEEKYGKKNEYYGMTLLNMASIYSSRNGPGDRSTAVSLGEKAITILPKGKPAYAQALSSLAVSYALVGDELKAQQIAKDAQKRARQIGEGSLNYATMLSNQGLRLARTGNYEQALEYTRQALAVYEHEGEDKSLNYARLLSNMASYMKQSERYEESITLWKRAIPIYKHFEGEAGSNYVNCMSEISSAMTRIGETEKASDINEELRQTISNQTRKGDVRFAQSLVKRAGVLASEGNYGQSIPLLEEALETFRVRKEKQEEAKILKDLSAYLFHSGQLKEAIDTCQTAIDIYVQTECRTIDYALALNSMSIYQNSNGQKDKAWALGNEAMNVCRQIADTMNTHYAKILSNLALYEAGKGNLQLALDYSIRAEDIIVDLLGKDYPESVTIKFNQATFLTGLGNKAEAQRVFHSALTTQMRLVRSNFSHLTTRGRELYWGAKKNIFHASPYMAYMLNESDSARIDGYNSQLFTKGLLLNSEVDFRNLLVQTKDKDLQGTYDKLVAIHQQMDNIWRSPHGDGVDNIPQLMDEALQLERKLIRGCKEYGDFTEAMSISYEQVCHSLPSNGAAIEFMDINTDDGDRAYLALVGKHGWNAPKLIYLFSEQDLTDLFHSEKSFFDMQKTREGINSIYDNSELGSLVWDKIIPSLDGVTDIFFSPSGMLYQLGIEYLKLGDCAACDKFTFHRLSSTKMLIGRQDKRLKSISEAVIYGGLNYDATPTELQTAISRLHNKPKDYLQEFTETNIADLAIAEERTIRELLREDRGRATPLPGTLIEAEKIGECLMQKDIDTRMLLGSDGTEDSFKSLSGKSTPIIHIATHGFSMHEEDVLGSKNLMTYLDVAQDNAAHADNSLCYSGLLFSGANNVLNGKQMPSELENGILTAREIASLDLRGTELVVLSACQTGLGELKEDGVFGLQRGFKKAGCKTLLMSLWNVDDDATRIMMTNFYTALSDGNTRQQALQIAREQVKASGYKEPFYWASFILLDD